MGETLKIIHRICVIKIALKSYIQCMKYFLNINNNNGNLEKHGVYCNKSYLFENIIEI